MKKTAVQWLIEKMLDSGIGVCKEWREQAKEMEKQQLSDGVVYGNTFPEYRDDIEEQAEIYYKWTYLKTDSEKEALKQIANGLQR